MDGPRDTGNVAFTASDGWRMDHLLGRAVNALKESSKVLPWLKNRAVTGLQYLGRGDQIEKVSWKEARACPVRDFSHSTHLAIIRLDFDATKLKFLPGVCVKFSARFVVSDVVQCCVRADATFGSENGRVWGTSSSSCKPRRGILRTRNASGKRRSGHTFW